MSKVTKAVSAYMARIGAKGGKSASGAKKRRSRAHYERIWAASAKARQKKKGVPDESEK